MNRNPWTRRLCRLAVALLCLAAARSSFATDFDWKLAASLDYESGKYGTDTRSSSLYVSVTLKRYWGDWDASLTIPYLSQKTDGRVTNIGGRPVRTGKGPVSAAAATTQSGLGDVIVRGGYALLKEDAQPLDLSLVAKIKVPTANKNKGLGTGKFDEGLGVEFGKRVVPGWTILADVYYTFIGDPEGTDLNNQAAADIGLSHNLTKELTATVLFEGSNALVTGQPAPLDLRGILDLKAGEQCHLFGGGLVGLSHGSPDYGVNLGASFQF